MGILHGFNFFTAGNQSIGRKAIMLCNVNWDSTLLTLYGVGNKNPTTTSISLNLPTNFNSIQVATV